MKKAEDLDTLEKNNPELFDEVTGLRTKIDLLLRRLGAPNCRMVPISCITNITTGVKIVDINYERRSFVLFNNSGFDAYAHNKQQNANDAGRWAKIPNGGYWEPLIAPTDAWYILGTSGQQEIFGYEGL